jgi:hypothetical protein
VEYSGGVSNVHGRTVAPPGPLPIPITAPTSTPSAGRGPDECACADANSLSWPWEHRTPEALLPAVSADHFVIRATSERGVGVPSSQSLPTASREANEVCSGRELGPEAEPWPPSRYYPVRLNPAGRTPFQCRSEVIFEGMPMTAHPCAAYLGGSRCHSVAPSRTRGSADEGRPGGTPSRVNPAGDARARNQHRASASQAQRHPTNGLTSLSCVS